VYEWRWYIYVSENWDKTIRVFDAKKMKELEVLEGHTGCVSSVGISEDRRYIAYGSINKTEIPWRLTNL
jgi:WD40 repeat protein